MRFTLEHWASFKLAVNIVKHRAGWRLTVRAGRTGLTWSRVSVPAVLDGAADLNESVLKGCAAAIIIAVLERLCR